MDLLPGKVLLVVFSLDGRIDGGGGLELWGEVAFCWRGVISRRWLSGEGFADEKRLPGAVVTEGWLG